MFELNPTTTDAPRTFDPSVARALIEALIKHGVTADEIASSLAEAGVLTAENTDALLDALLPGLEVTGADGKSSEYEPGSLESNIYNPGGVDYSGLSPETSNHHDLFDPLGSGSDAAGEEDEGAEPTFRETVTGSQGHLMDGDADANDDGVVTNAEADQASVDDFWEGPAIPFLYKMYRKVNPVENPDQPAPNQTMPASPDDSGPPPTDLPEERDDGDIMLVDPDAGVERVFEYSMFGDQDPLILTDPDAGFRYNPNVEEGDPLTPDEGLVNPGYGGQDEAPPDLPGHGGSAFAFAPTFESDFAF